MNVVCLASCLILDHSPPSVTVRYACGRKIFSWSFLRLFVSQSLRKMKIGYNSTPSYDRARQILTKHKILRVGGRQQEATSEQATRSKMMQQRKQATSEVSIQEHASSRIPSK